MKHDLHVINRTNKCKGVITRKRKKGNKIEESVIDYVIVNEDLKQFIDEMTIDDQRVNVLKNLITKKESDHNPIICNFNLTTKKEITEKIEIFNLRNKDNLKIFKENTEKAPEMISIFENGKGVKKQGEKWLKLLKNKIHKSFKKIKINPGKKHFMIRILMQN